MDSSYVTKAIDEALEQYARNQTKKKRKYIRHCTHCRSNVYGSQRVCSTCYKKKHKKIVTRGDGIAELAELFD